MMITHGKTGEPAENLNLQLAQSQFQTERGIRPSAVELMHAQWQPWHSVLRQALKEGAAILIFLMTSVYSLRPFLLYHSRF